MMDVKPLKVFDAVRTTVPPPVAHHQAVASAETGSKGQRSTAATEVLRAYRRGQCAVVVAEPPVACAKESALDVLEKTKCLGYVLGSVYVLPKLKRTWLVFSRRIWITFVAAFGKLNALLKDSSDFLLERPSKWALLAAELTERLLSGKYEREGQKKKKNLST